MTKFNAENERVKRQYLGYLKEAEGKDEKTLDQVAASLRDFELALNLQSFKKFHRDWGRRYKSHLGKAKSNITGKPLALSTRDARLRHVKAFLKWLACQSGYKSRISHSDVEYFNNNAKDARAAHTSRSIPFPSMEAALHAFQAMPEHTEIERRNKAIFAFLMLTGARDGAVVSLRLKHINLVDQTVFQDGREVNTKNSKSFMTVFFPVDASYFVCFSNWVRYLREQKLFGPEDALFPRPQQQMIAGKFAFKTLSREPYANSQKINQVVRSTFQDVGLHPYTPHSFRKTLAKLMNDMNLTLEQQKAWSQNLGHDSILTTVSSYLPVTEERQVEVMSQLKSGLVKGNRCVL